MLTSSLRDIRLGAHHSDLPSSVERFLTQASISSNFNATLDESPKIAKYAGQFYNPSFQKLRRGVHKYPGLKVIFRRGYLFPLSPLEIGVAGSFRKEAPPCVEKGTRKMVGVTVTCGMATRTQQQRSTSRCRHLVEVHLFLLHYSNDDTNKCASLILGYSK